MAQTGLGIALRTLRERRTLSLREVGQLSTVDHAYVHRLETGEKTSPSHELVAKLLKVLKPDERDAGIVKWPCATLVANDARDFALTDGVISHLHGLGGDQRIVDGEERLPLRRQFRRH